MPDKGKKPYSSTPGHRRATRATPGSRTRRSPLVTAPGERGEKFVTGNTGRTRVGRGVKKLRNI